MALNVDNCAQYQDSLNLHALGLLEADEAAQLQRHLDSGCDHCREELEQIQEAINLLPYELSARYPAPALKDRLFSRIHAIPQVFSKGIEFEFLEWKESDDMPGVGYHWLRRDESGTAALVRIRAGSRFVDHKHVGPEDCLVLRGKLHDSRGEYSAGDYVYYEAGSIQRDVTAMDEDCVIFVVNHNGIEPVD